jgi:hypothetical protein
MKHMILSSNCFQYCRCGKENGNDGSTIYAFSETGINTSFLSALRCPAHGDQCWYGIVILCNGVLDSRNVNMSNSDVQFIVGLAHFRPDYEKSILLYYVSTNQINGNALAFIDFTFQGQHQFGALVNDSSTSGIFYVQNTTTTLQNYYFLGNKGKITYACVGDSKGNFVNCVFSCPESAKDFGNGFGKTEGCLWKQEEAVAPNMEFLNTAFCEAVWSPASQLMIVSKGRVAYAGIAVFVVLFGVSGFVIYRTFSKRILGFRRRK